MVLLLSEVEKKRQQDTMATVEIESRQPRKRRRIVWDVAPSDIIQEYEPVAESDVVERYVTPPNREDDREGHYVFSVGENLTPRYKILSKMGEGTFGRVLECLDHQTKEHVAIKVVRSNSRYRGAAMIEIDVLRHLAEHDNVGSHCVQIRSWFDYRNHVCIVFEKLGPSLYDVLKRNRYRPFPVDLVQEFGRQLLESIACLGWSYPCDLWGIGCILVELCSGRALFQTHENLEHLAMMERVLGPLPQYMIQKATRGAEKYFRQGSRLNWPEGAESRESSRAVQKLEHLEDLISRHVNSSKSCLFIDLLYKLLRFDPSQRLTAKEALNHPFFKIKASTL
ncbi:serine/threonine-protein kinase AFC3 isoform X2 [Beta vulgaris subsp. vulgaris]|uniref:serine/threonine-protein kinase AFC3 isoform X2 n=1 Tax=Beta vulgaris subsp. vulgaris TaxID=3555 RepID=UPI002549B9F9|nr:serine/threonine-protein kinase AFC3 isoform X2 [Beta vulgaris subsp. vulgaris]